jgi:hypothetical protein
LAKSGGRASFNSSPPTASSFQQPERMVERLFFNKWLSNASPFG